jgi:hypothetical protein
MRCLSILNRKKRTQKYTLFYLKFNLKLIQIFSKNSKKSYIFQKFIVDKEMIIYYNKILSV